MKLPESRTPIKSPAVSEAEERYHEERYHAAKARLLAAQQEKIEAADEFLAARAALHSGPKTPRPAARRATEYRQSGCPAAWARV